MLNNILASAVLLAVALALACRSEPVEVGEKVMKITDVHKVTNLFNAEETSELDKRELFKAIKKASDSDQIAAALYKAKDKTTTKLSKDVTVAELLSLNSFVLRDCMPSGREKKEAICKRLSSPLGTGARLRRYCEERLRKLSDACFDMNIDLFKQSIDMYNELKKRESRARELLERQSAASR